MSDSRTSQELACPHCGGRLEAAAKVYFDLSAAERRADGTLEVTDLEFSGLNDSFDGHPVAMESELAVSCVDCSQRPSFRLAGTALLRTAFAGSAPADKTQIVVLNDGETFSAIGGCRVYDVPLEWGIEEIEDALAEGKIDGTDLR